METGHSVNEGTVHTYICGNSVRNRPAYINEVKKGLEPMEENAPLMMDSLLRLLLEDLLGKEKKEEEEKKLH